MGGLSMMTQSLCWIDFQLGFTNGKRNPSQLWCNAWCLYKASSGQRGILDSFFFYNRMGISKFIPELRTFSEGIIDSHMDQCLKRVALISDETLPSY